MAPNLLGKRLAHFRIDASLGAGAMGHVYRARDTRLERDVAIKVMLDELGDDPERLARFQREARAVASLNHPHIVTIHDVNQATVEQENVHFLIMELVEGDTLQRRLPANGYAFDELLELSAGIIDALACAHRYGIVHRDLKPANVMVTTTPQHVKMLDFGLAKRACAAINEQTQSEALTSPGQLVGTVPYMSPEQIEGQPIDARSDIFSLGVMLYEMTTGQRPFGGRSAPALISSILRDSPPPIGDVCPDVPRLWVRMIERCLEKNPTDRFASAVELVPALQEVRTARNADPSRPLQLEPATAVPRDKAVAVLPFVNRGRPEDDYFSDGLSEELIHALSRLPGIRVTARSSAFQFRGRETDVREVGQALGVDTVLEGSVRMAGNRIRITASLVNCMDGYQFWSQRFDSEMKDIFETQDEIIRAIMLRLEIELGNRRDPLIVAQTRNLDAYHLLLRARQSMTDFWEPGVEAAHEQLQQALRLDSEYAPAYADLAFSYLVRSVFGSLPGREAFPRVHAAAIKALELDPQLSQAHSVLGVYLAWHDCDWDHAERELRLAVDKEPGNVWNLVYLTVVQATARRTRDMLPLAQRARLLDPLNPIIHANVSLVLFYSDCVEEAEDDARHSQELFPDFWFVPFMRCLYAWSRGHELAALERIEAACELTGWQLPYVISYAAAAHFWFGHRARGEQLLDSLHQRSSHTYVSPTGLALVEIARERTDAAVALLEQARLEHDAAFPWIRAVCEQVGLIRDTRIRDTMARLGLP